MITEIRCYDLTEKERKLLWKTLRKISRRRKHRDEEKLKYIMKDDGGMKNSRPRLQGREE